VPITIKIFPGGIWGIRGRARGHVPFPLWRRPWAAHQLHC